MTSPVPPGGAGGPWHSRGLPDLNAMILYLIGSILAVAIMLVGTFAVPEAKLHIYAWIFARKNARW